MCVSNILLFAVHQLGRIGFAEILSTPSQTPNLIKNVFCQVFSAVLTKITG